jgi:amino acid adenylation domain-containing protein
MSARVEGFQASPQQRHLWSLRRAVRAEAGDPYVAEARVRIEGPLDVERLEAALRQVAERYEILRTTFATLDGMSFPVQVIDGALPLRLEVQDAGGEGASEEELGREEKGNADLSGGALPRGIGVGEVGVEELGREERRSFDLSGGPLLRVALVRKASGEAELSLALPALCADEPTLRLLLRDLFATYGPAPNEEGEILQYADLAAWQNDLLEAEESAAERRVLHRAELWAERAAALPCARSPEAAPFRPAAILFRLDAELAASVAALAAREGVGEDAVLLAGWIALLTRLTGAPDLVLGVACDGRQLEELRAALGPLSKHLPLRVEGIASMRFLDLVRRVAEELRHLGEWQQHFSLEELAGGAGAAATSAAPAPAAPRDAVTVGAGVRYFPVGFTFAEPYPDLSVDGLTLRIERLHAHFDRFDLALACRREGSEIRCEIRFDAGALRREDVEPLAGRLIALLGAACGQPDRAIATLPRLGEAERRRWLVETNATGRPALLGHTIPALFEARAALVPERVALLGEGETLTYGELDGRANRLANLLRRRGVAAEARVAVCLDRSSELVVALLAVLKAGGAFVPLDPTYPAARLAALLDDSGAAILITRASLAGLLSWQGATVTLDREAEALVAESGDRRDLRERRGEAPLPEHLAYVIYTSGSTGRPKGVMISHGAICNRLLWVLEELPLAASDRVLYKTPASFDASVWELFCPLIAGAAVVVARPGGHQDPEYLVRTLIEREVTVLQLVPSALRLLLEVPELDRAGSLRLLFCGGELLPADLKRRFLARLPAGLVNLYGPTEVSIDATFHRCRRDGSDDAGPSVPIGGPLANLRVYLLDRDLDPVVPEAPGELYVGGVGLARGYLGRPDLTAERFVPDSQSGEPGERLYRTGDLARFRSDGELEFLGRADQQVKIRGFRIEPGEIEAVLAAQPGVRAAVVAPREVRPDDVRLFAWIVAERGISGVSGGAATSVDAEGLRERLRATLPEHMVPVAFVFVEALPLLPNGKLDRAALPIPTPEGAAAELRTAVEDLLCNLWSDVLGRDDVAIHDNVFALGAHSLLVTQVVSRVRETFQVELPMRLLFDEPTVAGLARRIEELRRGDAAALPPMVAVPRGGPLPASFAQQRLWLAEQRTPGSSAYSTPIGFRLSGPLRQPRLAAAFGRLVERHESLRTTFAMREGQLVQQIGPAYTVPLQVIDLTSLSAAQRRDEVARQASPGSQPPFDLERGPLLRVALLRLGAEEHVLVVTLHHIVSDAWSTWVAVRELAHLYDPAPAAGDRELPPPALQYADFAAWQRERLQGEALAAEVAYWRRKLAGAPPSLDLPADFPRPAAPSATPSSAGDLRVRWLPAPLQEALRALGRRERSSLYMTLLAAWYVLLQHLSGRDDLVIGTSVAGRERLEVEGMIGFFINMLVLRADLGGDPTFAEVMRRVREVALDGYLHQAVPFDKLVEELQGARQTGRSPLFQVAFTFENAPGRKTTFGDLKLEPLEMRFDTSLFDLALLMEEGERGLWSGMRYRTALFRPATIDRWLALLETLLARVASDPAVRAGELRDLLAQEERRIGREDEEALNRASLRLLKGRTRLAASSQERGG